MIRRRSVTRRLALSASFGGLITSPAWARFLGRNLGGGAPPGAPSIIGVFVGGSSSVASGTASTPNADFGAVTATTSDSSTPTFSITGTNSQGYHLVGGHLEANSSTGAAPGSTSDTNIVASGSYSNSPQSITPTITATSGGISPDGTLIYCDVAHSPLKTLYGTWDFGVQYAGPGPDGHIYCYPTLNGREIIDHSGVEANELACRQLKVDNGGNLYMLTFSSIWNGWYGNWWIYDGAYPPGDPTPPALPPSQVTPPFTPSPDGTTITGGVGSLTSMDGVWSFGAVSGSGWNLMLNGALVDTFPAAQVVIQNHGLIWAQRSDTSGWYVRRSQAFNDQVSPPTTLPIPIAIDMTPSTRQNLLYTSPIGTLIGTMLVTMSDGSTFSGTYTVGPNYNGSQYAAASGNNLVTTVSPLPDFPGTGINQAFEVSAAQNGFSVRKLYVVTFTT